MNQCKTPGCGSWAINHHSHGRDGSDGDLCDVCYWRKRETEAAAELRRLAAVEQELEALKRAISDAEPVGFVTPETETVLKQFSGEDWCAIWNRETTKVSQPLYTLKGIK